MPANNAFSQQALAADPRFRLRLQNALAKVAWQVLEESPDTVHHAERAQYAHSVSNNPATVANQIAPAFVNRPNVIQFETSYSFDVGAVVTASGDADIESQLSTDWNFLAGITSTAP